MKPSARAIIIRGNKLLVMERHNEGQHYFALVGGTIELGETKEQALAREVLEETSLGVTNYRHVYTEEQTDKFGAQYVYLCDDPGGEVNLQADSIEAKLNKAGKNLFSPTWIDVDNLSAAPLMSPRIKQAIISAVKNTFPSSPILL